MTHQKKNRHTRVCVYTHSRVNTYTPHTYTYTHIHTYILTHALFVIQESGDNFSTESWLRNKNWESLDTSWIFFLKNREKEIIYNSFVTYYTYMYEWENTWRMNEERKWERKRVRENCWRPIREEVVGKGLRVLYARAEQFFHRMLAMPDTKQLTSSIFPILRSIHKD